MLVFDAVSLTRGGRLLFEQMDFALAPGEAIQVLGPNGSGKSSLLRLAAGLLVPTAGRVERPASCALADEQLSIDRDLPLAQAVAFWGGNAPRGLDAAGISHLADIPVRLLSSGQRKRAALARVFAGDATLWLLDEPLNALDREGTDRLDHAIADHRSSGGAVLAASHLAMGGDWRPLDLAA